MPLEMITVTIADVRTSLNEVDAGTIPDATIEQAIEEELVIVAAELPDDWESDDDISEDLVALLVQRRAAREAFQSSPTEVRTQALDAVKSYDIQSFRGRLDERVEKIYEILGLSRGGDSAAFVDATTSVFDDATNPYRDRG